mgnify:CR=1 FL=1
MKIRVMSDLHLEFEEANIHPGEGDVLVLAGDIITAADAGSSKLGRKFDTFFRQAVEGYNKVFYVMGNHEHYNGFFELTERKLRDVLPAGITLLQNQSELYEGVHFVGASLWTDFEGGDGSSMLYAQQHMNDYHVIHSTDGYEPLSPSQTLNSHSETMSWFRQCLPTLRGKVVVITHHAPCFSSFDEGYREEEARSAYVTNLSKFVRDHPNITNWFHGHVHTSKDYMLGQCRVTANAHGYAGCDTNIAFDDQLEVDV